MKKLTALLLALLLASGTMIGCEKDIPSEETTKTDYSKPPLETKAPEPTPVEGELVNFADEGILICSNPDIDVTEAFDLDISTAVRLDAANSDNWIGIKLPQPAILSYASFSAQDTDYDGTTNSPWDIYGHIIEGSNDGENWEFILQFGDPYAEYDDYAVEYDKGNNYATEYAFDGESEYDDDATEPKEYLYYRSWNDGKGGPLWGELELWGVLVGEPVETETPETKAPETKPVETVAPETVPPETKPVETAAPETKPAETKAPETKPAETAAPETKPAETKAPETKPVETAAPETKPAETKAPETKPVETAAPETKPVETAAPETKPVETVVPETKPVETAAPETKPVETEAPETEVPETEVPETEVPETEAPETEAPETEAPETEAPETEAPETEAPETEAPETEAPETEAPETQAPETQAPETEAPETEAPETEVPETQAPETEAPETEAPETEAPETEVPETQVPETKPAETEAPETTPIHDGISLQGEKYQYGDKDILVLEVENTTETHYTALLTVTFYNDAGRKVKTQKKMIEELPAGKKQSHLFQPNQKFASYTCEVSSVEEYRGTVYLDTLVGGEITTQVERDANKPTWDGKRATIISVRLFSTFGPFTEIPEGMWLRIKWEAVIFDNTGKVYTIGQQKQSYKNTETEYSRHNSLRLLSSTENLDIQIPKELTGEITVIMCLEGYEVTS